MRGLIYDDLRYSHVPWISTDCDLRRQGDPETVVSLSTGSLVGLYIKGMEDHIMLGIREDREGQPLSCAVTNSIRAERPTIVPAQSNPRRHHDSEDQA